MAEVNLSALLVDVGKIKGGYDSDLFIDNIEQFQCAICSGVCRDPQQISNCGHIFCKPCISYIISHSGFSLKCPLDNQPISRQQVKDDLFLKRLINSFKIKCTEHEKGCEWTGELDSASRHILSCGYRTAPNSASTSPIASPTPLSRPIVRTMPRLPSSNPPRPTRRQMILSMHEANDPIEATIPSPPPLPPRTAPNSGATSPLLEETDSRPVTPLDYPWYREGMSRKEAEQQLLNLSIEGGFVVRPSMTRTSGNYSLSIYYQRQILHFRVQKKPDNSFILGESISKRFSSVEELIDYYLNNAICMHDGRNAKLSNVFTTTRNQ